MNEKQWVCHISGQGEKWPVTTELADQWKVENDKPSAPSFYHFLPKSEYRLCDPLEVWEDVTETIKLGCEPSCLLYDELGRNLAISNGYRLRKVQLRKGEVACHQQWAFIVEKKVPA